MNMDRDTYVVRAYYDGFNPNGSPFTSEITIVDGELKLIDYLDANEFADHGLGRIMDIAYGHEEVSDEDYDLFMGWIDPYHQKICVDDDEDEY